MTEGMDGDGGRIDTSSTLSGTLRGEYASWPVPKKGCDATEEFIEEDGRSFPVYYINIYESCIKYYFIY